MVWRENKLTEKPFVLNTILSLTNKREEKKNKIYKKSKYTRLNRGKRKEIKFSVNDQFAKDEKKKKKRKKNMWGYDIAKSPLIKSIKKLINE